MGDGLGLNRAIVLATVALGLLLVGLAGALAYNQIHNVARARALTQAFAITIEDGEFVEWRIRDAEGAERAFVITHDARDLALCGQALAALPDAEHALAAMVAHDPVQRARVAGMKALIDERVRLMTWVLATAEQGDWDEAARLIRDGSARRLMAQIHTQEMFLRDYGYRHMDAPREAVNKGERRTLEIALGATAFAILGLIALIVVLGRANRSLAAALEAARVSRALSRALFVNNPDYLLVIDIEPGERFVIADINPALESVLRVDAAAVRGRVLSDLLPAQEAGAILPNLRRVAASDVPVMIRSEFNLPDGARTWESLLAPVKSAEGVTERIIASIRDITERIKTEDRLRESQKLESIGQLTGGVAHDFNNLLQVIRGNLELLAPMTVDNPLLQRRVGAIMNAADRAAQLTRQLLAFARRQPLEPQVINLATLVGDMTELLRRTLGESIDIKTVIAADLWNTVADPAQVESAVLNLALNARDAMDGPGRLTVEISNADLDESYVRDADGLTPGEYVLIAVSDTGQGMTPEIRKRVFEPFFTTKTEGKGTGLGLSMVYGFVRQSRGHIRLYSEPGEGTTVKMYLPRATGPVRAPLEALAGPPLSEGGDILVVEDDPAVRAVAVTTLETLGYRCLEAQDAATALAMLEAGARVDLVFSDVIMPGPVTARAFAERLADLAPSMPVLFTSGYTQGAVLHHGRLDEGVHLLSKPYSSQDLARKIAELLSLARDAAAPVQPGAGSPSAHKAKA